MPANRAAGKWAEICGATLWKDLMQNIPQYAPRGDDRRRADWQSNDRRQTWPWVTDSNDRRTGEDRRLNERRMRQDVAARNLEQARRSSNGRTF